MRGRSIRGRKSEIKRKSNSDRNSTENSTRIWSIGWDGRRIKSVSTGRREKERETGKKISRRGSRGRWTSSRTSKLDEYRSFWLRSARKCGKKSFRMMLRRRLSGCLLNQQWLSKLMPPKNRHLTTSKWTRGSSRQTTVQGLILLAKKNKFLRRDGVTGERSQPWFTWEMARMIRIESNMRDAKDYSMCRSRSLRLSLGATTLSCLKLTQNHKITRATGSSRRSSRSA